MNAADWKEDCASKQKNPFAGADANGHMGDPRKSHPGQEDQGKN
jgi:hypothetical protein